VRRGEQGILIKKSATTEYDRELFDILRAVRLELSRKRGIAPYMVFSDASLEDMARNLPMDQSSFLAMNGVGRKKLKQYGGVFIASIKNYVKSRGMSN
jgi:ATP-dependent DNA helicase RecQ